VCITHLNNDTWVLCKQHFNEVIACNIVQIDVPDTDISTSAKVVRGGSRVAYGHTYYTVPVVIPAAIGEGLHAELISKTKTDCMIKVKDRNNNDVGGNVDIRIKGY